MQLPLKLKPDGIHYYPNKAHSYNCFLNLAIGSRGTGKTTGWLIDALYNYNKRGEEFIYLRRYKPEIRSFLSSGALSNIVEGITYNGDGAGGAIFQCCKETIGYAKILSTAITAKSSTFPKVSMIIYDEAFLQRGSNYRYLKDEIDVLLNFASTIFRTRTNGKLVILGNNDDMFNPYFEYFNIPWFEKYYYNKERGIFAEIITPSQELLKMEEETPLFKLTKGTQFGEYHYSTGLLTNNKGIILPRPNGIMLYMQLRFNKYMLNIYRYYVKGDQYLWCDYVFDGTAILNSKSMFYSILDNNEVNYFNINTLRKRGKAFFEYMFYNERVSFKDTTSCEAFGKLLDLL